MLGRLQVAVFFSLYRAGRLLDHKVALGYEASTFVQRRGRFEETSRVHVGPERVAGPKGYLCLFRCMCGRVMSPRLAIMPSHRHEGPCVEHVQL